MTVLALN